MLSGCCRLAGKGVLAKSVSKGAKGEGRTKGGKAGDGSIPDQTAADNINHSLAVSLV